jgi:hypothetical protein
MGKLYIYLDAPEKAFDILEKVDHRFIVGFYALVRLIRGSERYARNYSKTRKRMYRNKDDKTSVYRIFG